ncbi:OLFR [Acanthosepion pharaonis]|uniref:OLFR n=1 Tax=Acanthosepion pharaonis TaxID=158019 RepID=A0A812CJR6_ACAPH|nr:OLFR [Sepia pharaonis]
MQELIKKRFNGVSLILLSILPLNHSLLHSNICLFSFPYSIIAFNILVFPFNFSFLYSILPPLLKSFVYSIYLFSLSLFFNPPFHFFFLLSIFISSSFQSFCFSFQSFICFYNSFSSFHSLNSFQSFDSVCQVFYLFLFIFSFFSLFSFNILTLSFFSCSF